jgi:restriction system protein
VAFHALCASEGDAIDFSVSHLEKIPGAGGEYQFDVVARFSRFGEAEFTVLVKCKRYSKAIERELVMVLHVS